MRKKVRHILNRLERPVSIAPLAVFRILFGGIMLISVIRFMAKGWVTALYVEPDFYFTYLGFDWVKPLGETGMYGLFSLMGLSAMGIMFGAWYRISASLFFLCFTYVELIDKTNYLNHYYFVSIVSFLMVLVPAHRHFSIDVLRKPSLAASKVPFWTIGMLRMQLAVVYLYAGIAKLNSAWLFHALPLKIWLPAKSSMPVIGWLLKYKATAFVFSWFGALYDLFIVFFLMWRRTRILAYGTVIAFHILTWILFPIGMFPWIMILSTLIFFPASFHEAVLKYLKAGGQWAGRKLWGISFPKLSRRAGSPSGTDEMQGKGGLRNRLVLSLLAFHFVLQFLLPWRYLLYPDNLYWTEEGYRFSWRVMLTEKAGYAIFRIKNPETGLTEEVTNSDYLKLNQEKMMAFQPDMILQFAHYLRDRYRSYWSCEPEVRAEVYVKLNRDGSRLFIDPERDLAKEKRGWHHKDWILPHKQPAVPAIRGPVGHRSRGTEKSKG